VDEEKMRLEGDCSCFDSVPWVSFSALALLVGRQEGHLVI